jgi:hypothetical protein
MHTCNGMGNTPLLDTTNNHATLPHNPCMHVAELHVLVILVTHMAPNSTHVLVYKLARRWLVKIFFTYDKISFGEIFVNLFYSLRELLLISGSGFSQRQTLSILTKKYKNKYRYS